VGQFDQNILYVCMEISQWNPLMQLTYANVNINCSYNCLNNGSNNKHVSDIKGGNYN
jgi:hypothetical protein